MCACSRASESSASPRSTTRAVAVPCATHPAAAVVSTPHFVPRVALDDVKRVLPGISGPTVVDVLNGGALVAVHAVVPAEGLDRVIEALQGVGATGILVTRIERLVP